MIRDVPELRNRVGVFRDRRHAGELLAPLLVPHGKDGTLVLGIPSGGVPVALVITAALGAGLDVLPVSKMLFPWTTEAGFGAVAFDGTEWIDERRAPAAAQNDPAFLLAMEEARAKVSRRTARLRRGRPFPETAGRTVIVVDDGVAAGSTLRTAVRCLRARGTGCLVLAVPTGHDTALAALEPRVDEICCANIRTGARFAVADAYQHWHDVEEEEVERLLRGSDGAEGTDRG